MIRAIRIGLWALVVVAGAGLGALALLPGEDKVAFGEPFGAPFSLVDQNGAAITEAAWRGHPSMVFFGFTNCPEVCPTTLYEMNAWLQQLGDKGAPIRAFFVTIDPDRDTPEVLGDYVNAISDRVTGITGDPEAVRTFARDTGIYFRKVPTEGGDYAMDHTASVFLLDSGGGLFGTIAYGESAEAAVAKLERLAKI